MRLAIFFFFRKLRLVRKGVEVTVPNEQERRDVGNTVLNEGTRKDCWRREIEHDHEEVVKALGIGIRGHPVVGRREKLEET